MAYRIYHNPREVRLDGTDLPGVRKIAWEVSRTEIVTGGDGELHASFARFGTARTRGELVVADPETARSVLGRQGVLTFVMVDTRGGANRSVTLAGCSFDGGDGHVAVGAASRCRLRFLAESAPAFGPAI